LQVKVETSASKDGPIVKLTVVNASNTYQIYQSITCSWQDFWRTDSQDAIINGQNDCAKNMLYTTILAPGEKHVETSTLVLFRGKPGRRTIRFGYSRQRSDFTSEELKRIHDSNEKYTYFSRTDVTSRFKPEKETFWSPPIILEATKHSIMQ